MVNKVIGFKCTLCHKELEWQPNIYTCPVCGTAGVLDVIYDYKSLKSKLSRQFFINNKDYSIWRYASIIPVDENILQPGLKVGWTPLYRSRRLAEMLSMQNLLIKDDGLNPTGSLKDRASAVAVAKAIEAQKDTVACSSTGNAASSLAGNAAAKGLNTVIFIPERAPLGKVTQLLIYGAKVISVTGSYLETYELSARAIERWGWYNRNAAINPHLVEGKKTVSLEIAEQLSWEVPDWVVVSVGDGCTVGGVYKGFYDLVQLGLTEKIPKIMGVQASGCCPFYIAYKSGQPLQAAKENTLADSIAVGVPRNPNKAFRAIENSSGTWMTVDDSKILEAMKILGSYEGIFAEPAAATSLAGLIKALHQGIIARSDKTVLISTGNGLKDLDNAITAVGEPLKVKPDMAALESLFEYN